jgi:hypothetical protein
MPVEKKGCEVIACGITLFVRLRDNGRYVCDRHWYLHTSRSYEKPKREMHEQDCMRCEETFEAEEITEFCPKCQKNPNRLRI